VLVDSVDPLSVFGDFVYVFESRVGLFRSLEGRGSLKFGERSFVSISFNFFSVWIGALAEGGVRGGSMGSCFFGVRDFLFREQ